MELLKCNELLREFSRLIRERTFNPFKGGLKVGVDLGTANIVISVVDGDNKPVAGVTRESKVVRDGIVVDYLGAVQAVREMKGELEALLKVTLDKAATAIPPGIIEGNIRAISNVVEAAGFEVTKIIDEPTAAAAVLGVTEGAVVDVGGGTTGISILKSGQVIYTNDEATGGSHMTLVLAGFHKITTDEAEELKKDSKIEANIFPIIRPVVEKMASIIKRYIAGHNVEKIYVVGGACTFRDFEGVFQKALGIEVIKPEEPLLVTPLGIAMNSN